MLRKRTACLLPPSLIEVLESRRLYSVSGSRLAVWADADVVDPNSLPPEAVIEVEAGVVDASVDGEPAGDESVAIDDGFIDPAVCFVTFLPDDSGEIFTGEVFTGEVLPVEAVAGEVAEGELVDPAVCPVAEPVAFDGDEDLLYTTTWLGSDEDYSIDPALLRGGDGIEKVLADVPDDEPVFEITGGVDPVEFVPGDEGVFVVDPLPPEFGEVLIDPMPVELIAFDGEEVLYTITGSEEPGLIETPELPEAPAVLDDVTTADVLLTTAALEASVDASVEPATDGVAFEPTPALPVVQVKSAATSWVLGGTGVAGQILGDSSDDEELAPVLA
jgi:hypothetical protein